MLICILRPDYPNLMSDLPPSVTKKDQILKLLESGMSANEIAKQVDTSIEYVYKKPAGFVKVARI